MSIPPTPCKRMFPAALPVAAKNWKCNRRMDKLTCGKSTERNTTRQGNTKQNKTTDTHTTTWKNFKVILPSRGSQTKNQVSFIQSSGGHQSSDRKLVRGCLGGLTGTPGVTDGFLTLTGVKVAHIRLSYQPDHFMCSLFCP